MYAFQAAHQPEAGRTSREVPPVAHRAGTGPERMLGNGLLAGLAEATGPAPDPLGGVLQRCGDHPCPPDGCDEEMHRHAATPSAPAPAAIPGSARQAVRGAGEPLAPRVRGMLEPRFGTSFADVRVHTDARSTSDVRAIAYTMGRDVVFAPGRYDPDSPAGLRLLAHELTHVVQQRQQPARPQGAPAISQPRGPDEREADAVADRVVAGHSAGPVHARPALVQRAISTVPTETRKPGARVCLVHLHGDEGNSRQVATDLQATFCANLVDLPGGTRNITVTGLPGGRSTRFDPNRVFTPAGIAGPAFESAGSSPRAARDAGPQVTAWVNSQLAPAISRCRGGGGTAVTDGTLPVVAFHNNSGLTIGGYRPGGPEAHATETDPTRLRGGATSGAVPANPSALPPGSLTGHPRPQNFLLVTDPRDFATFRSRFNVVLQEDTAAAPGAPGSTGAVRDDGSLSVALRGDRYINIEAFGKTFSRRTNPLFVENFAMGTEVLTGLGIPRACPPAPGTTPPAGTGTTPGMVDILALLRDEFRRVRGQQSTSPAPLGRDPVPSPPPRGCLIFADQAALDAEKTAFASTLAGMADADIAHWMIGISRPPSTVTARVAAQRDCMLAALRRAAAAPGSPITLTTAPVVSEHRDFSRQETRWLRKFAFTRGQGRFGEITAAARASCPALGTVTEWDPDDATHRTCWAGLSDEQKQREILRTFAAPGTSRHHWGTDIDLWSTTPRDFEAGQPLADEYSWLIRNASTYGFIQSFTPLSTFMRLGYTEERWHWSYYPIAQALLEWAETHRTELDTRLRALWGTRPEYSFLVSTWQDFMFNVNQTGSF